MSLGNSRPRNGGVDHQLGYLAMVQAKYQLGYEVRTNPRGRMDLWVRASNGEMVGPWLGGIARLTHVRRGRWEATSDWDGHLIACGISLRDLIGKTLWAVNQPKPWPLDN